MKKIQDQHQRANAIIAGLKKTRADAEEAAKAVAERKR